MIIKLLDYKNKYHVTSKTMGQKSSLGFVNQFVTKSHAMLGLYFRSSVIMFYYFYFTHFIYNKLKVLYLFSW